MGRVSWRLVHFSVLISVSGNNADVQILNSKVKWCVLHKLFKIDINNFKLNSQLDERTSASKWHYPTTHIIHIIASKLKSECFSSLSSFPATFPKLKGTKFDKQISTLQYIGLILMWFIFEYIGLEIKLSVNLMVDLITFYYGLVAVKGNNTINNAVHSLQ